MSSAAIIPAHAGIQGQLPLREQLWIPAFAGMTETRYALRATDLLRSARQDLHDLRLGVSAGLEPLGRDLTQIVERGVDEPRHALLLVVLGAPFAPHARKLLADGSEPRQHHV